MARLVALLALLIALTFAYAPASITRDRPIRQVTEEERVKLGLPVNICPDDSFTLFSGTYSYFCYQRSHPVSDSAALPWCPTYGLWPLGAIGVYSLMSNNMTCPPNTVHAISQLDTMPPSNSPMYNFCFYNITIFPQQTDFASYCYHWSDPSFTTGVGYAFVWKQ